MDDLISRRDAIDAFEKELSVKYNHREMAVGFIGAKSILENLPSAQPEIIRGKDCEWLEEDGFCIYFMTNDPDDYCSWAERRKDG